MAEAESSFELSSVANPLDLMGTEIIYNQGALTHFINPSEDPLLCNFCL